MAKISSAEWDDRVLQKRLRILREVGPQALHYLLEKHVPGFVDRAMKMTPPYSPTGGTGLKDAQRAGEAKIGRDLLKVFQPVKIKGTNKRGKKTVEVWPDVAAAYRARKVSAGDRWKVSRLQKAALYADESKVSALRDRLIKSVGKLAASFIPMARKVRSKRRIPAFILRHELTQRLGTATTNMAMVRQEQQIRPFVEGRISGIHIRMKRLLEKIIEVAARQTEFAMLREADYLRRRNIELFRK